MKDERKTKKQLIEELDGLRSKLSELDKLAKKNKYEEIIESITGSVHKSIDVEEVYHNAVAVIKDNIDRAHNVSVYMIEGTDAVLRAYEGYPDWFIEKVTRIPPPKGFTWKVLSEGKPIYCSDVDKDNVIGAFGKKVGTKSYASLPIKSGGKTVGCININSYDEDSFDTDEIKLFDLVARHIEQAIDNARQAEEIRSARDEFEQRVKDRTSDLELANETLQAEIAEHKRTESLLKETQERYITLIENVFDLIIEITITGEILYASPKHEEVLGYTAEEMIGQNSLEYVHPDDFSVVMQVFQKAIIELKSVQTTVYRCRHKSGMWRWLESSGRPFQSVDGDVRGVIASRDITERKLAEEALVMERERLEVTMGSISDGIILIDSENRILLSNEAGKSNLKKLTTAKTGDVINELGGHPIDQVLAPKANGEINNDLEVSGPTPMVINIIGYPTKMGKESTGLVLSIRDITEEKQRRDRIETQGRLAAVGQLAAGIAHDFNNALTTILGFSQIIQKDEATSSKNREFLELIIEQGHRASQLVHQILDFSRQSVSERQHMDLEMFLRKNVNLLERTIPENIKVTADFTTGNYWTSADTTQIQQVITNLALNARDAMPEGGELVLKLDKFNLELDSKPPIADMPIGEWIMFSVSDTGCGIEADKLPRIFEPFFTTKSVREGTGLGLAQVYGIIKQHDGFIDVESKVDVGSTFTIYIPATSLDDAIKSETPKNEDIVYGRGERILLVEDEPTLLQTTKTMLETLGYEIVTAANGQQALKIYNSRPDDIELVISDMVMPEMDGVSLFESLKEANSDVKVLLTTGYAVGDKAKELLSQGVVEWMKKPTDLVTLSKSVGNALGK